MIVIEPAKSVATSGGSAGRAVPIKKRELTRFLALAQQAVGLRGAVSVLLAGDETLRQLNRQFRKKNKATDVLSFPAMADAGAPQGAELAGDLAISMETAARQAEAFGHSLETEVRVLLVHGLLHLAGYDHETDAGEMARKEAALRRKFELPPGLIQRADSAKAVPGQSAKKATAKKVVTKKAPVKTFAATRGPARKGSAKR